MRYHDEEAPSPEDQPADWGHGRGRRHWMFDGPFGPMGGGPWSSEGWGRGRGPRGPRGWGRARRGDVRGAVLALLAERPMHGYEIISELSERTEGIWKPSPGSIYPTLQLLEDEGLVTAEAEGQGGRRRYGLTDEGRTAAAEFTAGRAPWEEVASGTPGSTRALLRAAATLVPVVRQVAFTGSAQDAEEAAKILDDARRRLYAVLASERQ
jgi:DNA-binding PadR family transcriptional regulator